MRKALIVGVDHYESVTKLNGCVNDSFAVKAMLERHADGSVNFGVKHLTAISASDCVTKDELRSAVQELFSGDGEISLFYFAGHGHLESTGGYLCSSEVKSGHDGMALAEVITMANQSKIQNRVVVLDSCHSGVAAGTPLKQSVAEISEGVTILTASTAEQYATEEDGAGVFTSLLVDALGGAAMNLVGDVTPGGVYAHIDQSLGPWAQRPVFKTNVKRFVSLRKVQPPLELAELRKLSEFFPSAGFVYQLDPTYEPERLETKSIVTNSIPDPDSENVATFAVLQKYNRTGLLIPEGAPHMWHAAMESKGVRLTALGEHYRKLVSRGLI
jgi:Caspase domain